MNKKAYLWEANPDKFRLLEERKGALKKRATKEELYFAKRLDKMGVLYVFQKGIIRDKQFIIADFFIPKLQLIVEIDGGYHNDAKQRQRDYFKDRYYFENGYNVLRINNDDVYRLRYYEMVRSILSDSFTDYMKSVIVASELGQKEKEKKVKIVAEGQPCRKCDTPVVLRKSKKAKVYSHYYYCENCNTPYMHERFKMCSTT